MLELLHPAYYSAALALCPQAFLRLTILTTPVICAPVILPIDLPFLSFSFLFFSELFLAYKDSLPVCLEETRAGAAIWTLVGGGGAGRGLYLPTAACGGSILSTGR